MTFHVPEKFRVTTGPASSTSAYGNNGLFVLPAQPRRPRFLVQASDGGDWEHVSVSTTHRCPTWEEMCWIKSVFWDADDCVMQFHPPMSEYVNAHPYCLHLWRPVNGEIARPPAWMVGPVSEMAKEASE